MCILPLTDNILPMCCTHFCFFERVISFYAILLIKDILATHLLLGWTNTSFVSLISLYSNHLKKCNINFDLCSLSCTIKNSLVKQ